MKAELRELERRAKALGFGVERQSGGGGSTWLAVTLPGDTDFRIACHHVYGGLHVNLLAQAHNSQGLLAEARRIADAHHRLMQCPVCEDECLQADCIDRTENPERHEAEEAAAKAADARDHYIHDAFDRAGGR